MSIESIQSTLLTNTILMVNMTILIIMVGPVT